MTPGPYALALYRGDSYRWRFVLWADSGKTTPADLTGVTVRAELRTEPGGALIYLLPTVVTLPQTIDAELTAAACKTLPAGGVWDLELSYPDGTVTTVLAGAVTVRNDVTTGEPARLRAVRP